MNRIRDMSTGKQFDAILFAAALAVTAIGYYYLYLVHQTFPEENAFSLNRQLLAIGIGVAAALFLASVDYRYFQIPSYIGYIGSVFVLLLTAVSGAGGESTGNRNWYQLLGVSFLNFQPSELAKITFVVVSSTFFERIAQKRAKKSDYIKLLLYAALPIGLIIAQRDTGTMMVFVFMFGVMVFVGGLKYRYIFGMIGAMIAALPVLWTSGILSNTQKMRIMVFLNPELDKAVTGYQPNNARLAIGAGELFGNRVESQMQTRYSIVPARHTDFIFTAIAENLGFIGSVALILLYVVILLRCFHIASRAADKYGSFMVAGLTGMLMFHFIENVGMNIGIMPITGIPLPFVSYGGTAMITNFVAIGIIQSVSVTRDKPGGLLEKVEMTAEPPRLRRRFR